MQQMANLEIMQHNPTDLRPDRCTRTKRSGRPRCMCVNLLSVISFHWVRAWYWSKKRFPTEPNEWQNVGHMYATDEVNKLTHNFMTGRQLWRTPILRVTDLRSEQLSRPEPPPLPRSSIERTNRANGRNLTDCTACTVPFIEFVSKQDDDNLNQNWAQNVCLNCRKWSSSIYWLHDYRL